MEGLLSWASAKGAACKVTTRADKPRTFFAAEDITPGDVVFSIPTELLLHGSLALSDPQYGPAFRALLAELGPGVMDQRSLLVLLLVIERARGSSSFWAPYINMLPQQYDDPFWWSEADLQLLQGSRLQQAVRHYTAGLQQLHTWLQRLEQLHNQQQQQPEPTGSQHHQQQQWQEQFDPTDSQQQQQQHPFDPMDCQQQPQQQQQQPEPTGNQQQQQRRQQQQQCGARGAGAGGLTTALGGWGLSMDAVKRARSAVWSRAFTIKRLNLEHNPAGNSASGAAAAAASAAGNGDGLTLADGASSNNSSTGSGGGGGDSSSAVIALVPVMDMCDHQPDQRVTWRVVQQQHQQQPTEQQQQQRRWRQVFQFTTLKPVCQGYEVFNNYGTTKPNEELLLGYGFVLQHNPHDSFLISISSSASGTPVAAAAATAVAVPNAALLKSDEAANKGAEQEDQDQGMHVDTPANAAVAAAASCIDHGFSSSSSSSSVVVSEDQCENAAEWQQRLAMIAAAGLQLDVPISVSRPLPQQLLDVLLVATAIPTWQLTQLLAAVQNRKAVHNFPEQLQQLQDQNWLEKQQEYQQQSQQQQFEKQQPQEQQSSLGLFAAALPGQRLCVLLQLKQQLTAKLQGMVPGQQLEPLLLLPGAQQQQQQQQQQEQQQQGANISNPHHASLAAAYVLSQQQVLQAALAGVQCAVQDVLLSIAVPPTPALPAAALPARDAVFSTVGTSSGLPVGLSAARLGSGFSWCSTCKALYNSSSIAAGSVVLQLPLHSCLAAQNEQQLTVLLMLAAAGLLPDQQQNPEQQQQHEIESMQQQQQQQQEEEVVRYFSECWQQQQQQQSCHSMRVIPWWLLPEHQEFVGLLEDTPAGQQLAEAAEELQEQYSTLLERAASSAPASLTAQLEPPTQEQLLLHQHLQPQLAHALLSLNSSNQQTALKMYCWASRVVKQAAVQLEIPLPQQRHGTSKQQHADALQLSVQQQCKQLVLVPGLEQLCKDLRSLTLAVSIIEPTTGEHQHQQQQQLSIAVTSTCALPACLTLSSSSSNHLLGCATSCQQLLIDQGPAAVAAAAATAAAVRKTAATAKAAAAGAAAGIAPQLQRMQHVYELVVCPSEDDPLRPIKLQLLAATGSGLSHYLTLSVAALGSPQEQQQQQQQEDKEESCSAGGKKSSEVSTQQQQQQQQQLVSVLAAMAVALCDDEQLLQADTVQHIAQQRQQVLAAVTAGSAAAAVASTAGMLLEVDNTGGATSAAASSGKHDVEDVWEALKSQLLMKYGKACRKQLREVLKRDAQAVLQALGQLRPARLTTAAATAAMTAAMAAVDSGVAEQQQRPCEDSAQCSCCICCHSTDNHTVVPNSSPGDSLAMAEQGVIAYLAGLSEVLTYWMQLLQEHAVSSKAAGRKQAGEHAGKKRSKKQRHQ